MAAALQNVEYFLAAAGALLKDKGEELTIFVLFFFRWTGVFVLLSI
jgi:hypothetical protein